MSGMLLFACFPPSTVVSTLPGIAAADAAVFSRKKTALDVTAVELLYSSFFSVPCFFTPNSGTGLSLSSTFFILPLFCCVVSWLKSGTTQAVVSSLVITPSRHHSL